MRTLATRERSTPSIAERAAFDEAVAIYTRKVADCRRRRLGADLLLVLACVMLASSGLFPPVLRLAALPVAFGLAWAGVHLGECAARARARLRW
ncbi:hypothetical protein [Dyella japonica]|uniref:Uncharacterized protein n=1 Tax=Dyella japonica A8 TaxID=1217721 RepID=A0A075K2I0_9GAMM|nr:hypothetical protein [Dyella japonica]AIF48080.1 hypothetical protein HY57_12815 [Dyella japonica A8]